MLSPHASLCHLYTCRHLSISSPSIKHHNYMIMWLRTIRHAISRDLKLVDWWYQQGWIVLIFCGTLDSRLRTLTPGLLVWHTDRVLKDDLREILNFSDKRCTLGSTYNQGVVYAQSRNHPHKGDFDSESKPTSDARILQLFQHTDAYNSIQIFFVTVLNVSLRPDTDKCILRQEVRKDVNKCWWLLHARTVRIS